MDSRLSQFRAVLSQRLGIDARALATFRISLGIVLLIDLVLRFRDLRLFYTDAGVLPVSLLAEKSTIYARISLHALSGELWYQVLLFAVAIAVAVGLVLGYHTRLVTLGSFVLLVSLHARNPYVLNGGDALLQHLLFWSLFLPLGARWSIDAGRDDQSRDRVFSAASAGLLIQVLLVYGVNAVLKLGSESWMNGEAVSMIFALDRFISLLGPLFRELPLLLEITNWVWIVLLATSPLLVLSAGRIRMTLIGAFAITHLGMLLTMNLGIFPLVSIVALVPFVPTGLWDRVEESRVSGGLRTAGFDRPIRPQLGVSSRLSRVWNGYEQRLPTNLSQVMPALALVVLVSFNAIAVGVVPAPQSTNGALSGDRIDSRWALFAPNPPTTERWFVGTGHFSTGERTIQILWTGSGRNRTDLGIARSSARLRKYMSHVRFDREMATAVARSLCERWEEAAGGQLRSVTIVAVDQPVRATTDRSQERILLTDVPCHESP